MIRKLSAALMAALFAFPALAHDGIHILLPYARATAHSGAIFLVIENHSSEEDRLVSISTDAAGMAELHTHQSDANGVMQMLPVQGGLVIPAGGSVELARGGDHIMLMGLARPLADGDHFTVTLTFARGEVIPVEVVVDNERKPSAESAHSHGHTP